MTLSKLTIITFLLFCCRTVQGQTSSERLDTIVASFLDELRVKGVDTFCVYQDYCVGCDYNWKSSDDRCGFEGLFIPTYIFWLGNGQTYMTKKDNCFDYSVIKVDSDSIWQLFFTNRHIIEREEIKMPQYVEVKNGKTETYSSSIDHSWHQGIQVIIGNDTIINKNLDEYYFSKEVGNAKRKNINYEYNVNSFLNRLQALISRTIKDSIRREKLQKARR